MFCPACGRKIYENARFCQHCGADIAKLTEAAQPQQQPVSAAPDRPDYQRRTEKKPGSRWRNVLLLALIVVVVAALVYGVIKFLGNADEPDSANTGESAESGAALSVPENGLALDGVALANFHAQSALYVWLNGGAGEGSQLTLEDISPYAADNLGELLLSENIQSRYPDSLMPTEEFDTLLYEVCGADYNALAVELEALGYAVTDDGYVDWGNASNNGDAGTVTQMADENGLVTFSVEIQLDDIVTSWELAGEPREGNSFAPYELTTITLVTSPPAPQAASEPASSQEASEAPVAPTELAAGATATFQLTEPAGSHYLQNLDIPISAGETVTFTVNTTAATTYFSFVHSSSGPLRWENADGENWYSETRPSGIPELWLEAPTPGSAATGTITYKADAEGTYYISISSPEMAAVTVTRN